MENGRKTDTINIRNNDQDYAIIRKDLAQINTVKIKSLIVDSEHVKSYLDTPFHSITNLFSTIPEIQAFILPKISPIIAQMGSNYRCIKSTYYDKPPGSDWELGFHQDVHINLKDKLDDTGFDLWVKRNGYFQVKPPVEILENMVTLRIHLDDCTEENGALMIVPGSQKSGFIDVSNYKVENAITIELKEGDILKVNPLLLHAASRNTTLGHRRIIHLEFSNQELPWYEEYFLKEIK